MRGTCSKVGKHGSQSLAYPEASTKMEAPDAEKPLGRTNARHWHIGCAWSKISVMFCKLWFGIWRCCWMLLVLQPVATTAAVWHHCSCEQPPGKEESQAYAKVAGTEGLFANLALQDSEPVGDLMTEDMLDQAREANKAVDAVKKAFDEAAAAVKGKAQHHGTAILSFCSSPSSPLFILLDDLIIFDLDPGCWPRWEAKAKEGELSQVEPVIFGLPVTFACFRCLAIFNHIQSTQNSTTACQSHDVHIIYQSV